MVISFAHIQAELYARLVAGFRQELRLQLFLEEIVARSLIDQDVDNAPQGQLIGETIGAKADTLL